jgi:hypothetical protein
MIDSRYTEIPLPPAAEDLLIDDIVTVRYDLFQGGTWFLSWQVGKLETQLEEDGRFMVRSYSYDEANNQITFELQRNPDPATKVLLAGGFGWGVLLGLVTASITYFAYEYTAVKKVYRRAQAEAIAGAVAAIDANPDLAPEQKAEAKQSVLQSTPKAADSGLVTLLLWGGAVILALLYLETKG